MSCGQYAFPMRLITIIYASNSDLLGGQTLTWSTDAVHRCRNDAYSLTFGLVTLAVIPASVREQPAITHFWQKLTMNFRYVNWWVVSFLIETRPQRAVLYLEIPMFCIPLTRLAQCAALVAAIISALLLRNRLFVGIAYLMTLLSRWRAAAQRPGTW